MRLQNYLLLLVFAFVFFFALIIFQTNDATTSNTTTSKFRHTLDLLHYTNKTIRTKSPMSEILEYIHKIEDSNQVLHSELQELLQKDTDSHTTKSNSDLAQLKETVSHIKTQMETLKQDISLHHNRNDSSQWNELHSLIIDVKKQIKTQKLIQNSKHINTEELFPIQPALYEEGPLSDKYDVSMIDKKHVKLSSKRGQLVCNGSTMDSEVIYWKIIPNDSLYTSPYKTKENEPKKYLTFKYDPSGYNNLRMSLESLIVLAHAMGRILVIPPDDHEDLLRAQSAEIEKRNAEIHKDPAKEMGVDDILNISLLRSHKG
jgi:hypothetical protein